MAEVRGVSRSQFAHNKLFSNLSGDEIWVVFRSLTILVSGLDDTGCVFPFDPQGGCSDTHVVVSPGVESSDGVVLSGMCLNFPLDSAVVLT